MLNQEQQDYATKATRTLQIIIGSLIAGPLAYTAYAIATHDSELVDAESSSMSLIGLGFALIVSVASLIAPRVMFAQQRRAIVDGTWKPPQASKAISKETGDVGPLLGAFQAKTIVGAALLEGGTFMNTFAYTAEGKVSNLLVVAALLIGVALYFPFLGRITSWLERELSSVEQLRQLGGR
ncbi:hypothetical protein [Adhaeretor mobilis]|uniref:Uncharacterized protein n=1 Tax=Adhaeretor mobilis TaxID=1930276 RepID=A0A517MR43_9BACT|nr:hypothetical protein [Adhaeretor mobilis]QDS97353.1 hypothetical protein HG15A2_06140 [Adhaeretor mobilis]